MGWIRRREWRRILEATYRNQRNEGGNDLVFLNLQGARLGLLDLERFKRQINYCLLPNGTCTDMVLQVLWAATTTRRRSISCGTWASGSRTSGCRW